MFSDEYLFLQAVRPKRKRGVKTLMGKQLKISIYCTCGDRIVGRVSSAELADSIMQLFALHHNGDGHSPTQPKLSDEKRSANQRRAKGA